MKMIIEVDGKTFTTAETDEIDKQTAADQMYENLNRLSKLLLELDDGSILLLGEDVLNRCTFRFVDK